MFLERKLRSPVLIFLDMKFSTRKTVLSFFDGSLLLLN